MDSMPRAQLPLKKEKVKNGSVALADLVYHSERSYLNLILKIKILTDLEWNVVVHTTIN